MGDIFIDFFGKMLQEFIHLVAFVLYDFVGDAGCFVIDFFEIVIRQSADFFGFLFGDVTCMGKSGREYTGHVFNLLFRHYASFRKLTIRVREKYLRSKNQALISPLSAVIAAIEFSEPWIGGIAEKWGSKADVALTLFSGPCHPWKRSDSAIPNIPTFQYSITPQHRSASTPIAYNLAQMTKSSMLR
jgi:hypothetical protein